MIAVVRCTPMLRMQPTILANNLNGLMRNRNDLLTKKKKKWSKIFLRDNLAFSYSVHVSLNSIAFERKVISFENACDPLALAFADIDPLNEKKKTKKKQIDVQFDANEQFLRGRSSRSGSPFAALIKSMERLVVGLDGGTNSNPNASAKTFLSSSCR